MDGFADGFRDGFADGFRDGFVEGFILGFNVAEKPILVNCNKINKYKSCIFY